MACNRHVKYYLTNNTQQIMYGYNTEGKLDLIFNLPWMRPFLFSSVKKARQVAVKEGLTVRFWKGKKYPNSSDDNM